MNERIASAWQNCGEWLCDYNGNAPHEAYLGDIAIPLLKEGIITISSEATKFSIQPLWTDTLGESVEDQVSDVHEAMSLVEQSSKASLNVFYTTQLDDFIFEVHFMVDKWAEHLSSIEVIWWADQVFPPEVNRQERFASVIKHFIYLQNLFQCNQLYVTNGTASIPEQNTGDWIEV